jgi:hypothetical protein
MTTAKFETTTALEAQVTQVWGTNVIAQKHASEGAMTFLVAESEIEIARWTNGELWVSPPNAAPFVVRGGEATTIVVGDFTFHVGVSEREKRIEKNVAAAILSDGGLRSVAGSATVHAALLAAVAFFMPSMSEANDDVMDRQRMLDLKAYIQSAAEREQEQPKQETTGDTGGSSNPLGGQPARNEAGAMGTTKEVAKPGRWSAKGDEKPENAQLAREHALKEAAEFGMIGLLASANSDPNAPVVPWGNVLAGSDRESHMGNLWSGDLGDAFGTGLGLSGPGEGGGGKGNVIGLGGISGLGHLGGNCDNNGHCDGGNGHGHGRLPGTYVPHGPRINWNPQITTNGRLDPSVIQRIVRQNSGRFVGCYQDGLRTNPSLEGRVAVAFAIGRDGSVTMSHDTSGSDLPDQNVRSCVAKAFFNLSFPEPAGGIVSVTYPLSFTPQ